MPFDVDGIVLACSMGVFYANGGKDSRVQGSVTLNSGIQEPDPGIQGSWGPGSLGSGTLENEAQAGLAVQPNLGWRGLAGWASSTG